MQIDTTSLWAAVFPIMALGLLIGGAVTLDHTWLARRRETARRISRPVQFLWLVPFAGALAFLAAWCVRHLLITAIPALAIVSFIIALCGLGTWARGPVIAFFDARPRWVRAIRDIVIILIASMLAMTSMELSYNREPFAMWTRFIFIELALVAGLNFFLYGIGQRHGVTVCIGVTVFLLIGVAEYFVIMFRNDIILPRELVALSTAASVAGNYDYLVNTVVVVAIGCACFAYFLLSFIVPKKHDDAKTRKLNVLLSFVIALVFGAGTVAFATVPNYDEAFDMEFDYWFARDYYDKEGFLPAFIYAVQDLAVKVPDGYNSPDDGLAAQAKLISAYNDDADAKQDYKQAQTLFEKTRPNVVVIMNETFADLSSLENLHDGYKGPQFFKKGLKGVFARGNAAVSPIGGGTCNSEYEFITGNSMGTVGVGKYPYEMFHMKNSSSIARQFKELGYGTTAMHPNAATNWSRNERYPELGFDTFMSIADFEGAPEYHNGVTDLATYEKVIGVLEDNDEPQFVFDVTMQNHSGYNKRNIPEKDLLGIEPPELDEETTASLNEYLACIEASDRDLKKFAEKLEKLDEPTVVLFFGDHHPHFTPDINDLYFTDEDETEHVERTRQTVYAAWANFDLAVDQDTQSVKQDASVNFLAALLLSKIGGPLTDFQQAQLGLRQQVPALNPNGYLGDDGHWYSYEAKTPYSGIVNLYQQAAYYHYMTHTG